MFPPPSPPLSRRRLLAAAGSALLVHGCRQKPAPPPRPVNWFLTPLAPPPDWDRLAAWQETLTKDEFTALLDNVLTTAPGGWFTHIQVEADGARIRRASRDGEAAPPFFLRFARESVTAPVPGRWWRTAAEMPPLSDPARPLDGVHIAIDPGHIGGLWAVMEERWYRMGEAAPVQEGDLTLATARVLQPLLEGLGARVSLVRKATEPLTTVRPPDLLEAARLSLEQDGKALEERAIRKESERLFYRASEIRARGRLVNDELRPDLVLCLHFNADSWGGNPAAPRFSTSNHLHVIAHGCLLPGELTLDDQRLETLVRVLQRIPDTEIPLCRAVATRMAEATGLPPYRYAGASARQVPEAPFVWIRNLLANRVYECPVVFLEPYVMNHAEVFARIQAGDYTDEREVAGIARRSIFREYAAGVAQGLADHFLANRRRPA